MAKLTVDRGERLPSAVSLFLRSMAAGVFGDNESEMPFTEKSLSPDELKALRVAVQNARHKGRNFIIYEDYPIKDSESISTGSFLKDTARVFNDPAVSAMLSVGKAVFDENNVITDRYNFDFTMPTEGTSALQGLAMRAGLGQTGGRKVKIDLGEGMDPESEISFGRLQAEASRQVGAKNGGPTDRNRALQAGQDAVKHLMGGLAAKNAPSKSSIPDDVRPIDDISLRNSSDPEAIKALVQKVIEAAMGKPVSESISTEMDMQKEAERSIGMMVLQQLMGGQSRSGGESKTQSKPAKESP